MMKKTVLMILLLFAITVYPNNQIEDESYNEIKNKIEIISDLKIPNYVDAKYVKFIYITANAFELPIRLIFRLINWESKFKHNAINKTCIGFMQVKTTTYNKILLNPEFKKIIPDNWDELDINQKYIFAGMFYLKEMHNAWVNEGNSVWTLAVRSYNEGIGNVINNKNTIPTRKQKYINYILN
jgi:soluble lytic murein transglycosylase-like protein